MIIPVWQNLYQSSHKLAQSIGEKLDEPATHTGTLDPLAEGVLVVLTGEDRFLKGKLKEWKKVYEFSILWGVQTDSGDKLGLIQKLDVRNPKLEDIEKSIAAFPPTYLQTIPDFSARRWRGTSAFDAAKKKEPVTPKSREVTIQFSPRITTELLSVSSILQLHQQAIHQVTGEFRQAEVLSSWQKALESVSLTQQFLVTRHEVRTSPGTYIRQLVQDLAVHVGVPATTWSITRTQNGPYSRKDVQGEGT